MANPWHETILVVEDAESIRGMVCAMLCQSGYHCLEAGDGAEALDILETDGDSVSLILTDIVMPRMTGAELARHVARIRPEIRIMFMSGYSDDAVVRTIERSAAIFLAKPFTASILIEKVREALDHPWVGLQAGATNSVSK
jgi:two-component system, cell cycle sensor histidine kinase and response regulator CckA